MMELGCLLPDGQLLANAFVLWHLHCALSSLAGESKGASCNTDAEPEFVKRQYRDRRQAGFSAAKDESVTGRRQLLHLQLAASRHRHSVSARAAAAARPPSAPRELSVSLEQSSSASSSGPISPLALGCRPIGGAGPAAHALQSGNFLPPR